MKAAYDNHYLAHVSKKVLRERCPSPGVHTNRLLVFSALLLHVTYFLSPFSVTVCLTPAIVETIPRTATNPVELHAHTVLRSYIHQKQLRQRQ